MATLAISKKRQREQHTDHSVQGTEHSSESRSSKVSQTLVGEI